MMTLVGLLLCSTAFARGVDPKADAAAVARMQKRMAEIRKHRPTVALVLSGGGAKGTAHVEVIRYIEELGIPVDLVVGTSMGGLIGGLYSLGYPVNEMDSLVRNMDWGWVMSDKLSREYVSYTDTKYKEKYLLSIPFFYEKDYYKMKKADEYRFDDMHRHEILNIGADNRDGAELLKDNLLGSLPSGYLFGQNVSNLISSLTVGYQDSTDFQTLPIPFVCVAADLVTGKAKIWHSGKMNVAMRSTMSIPGVFAPVKTDGMVLVDGGIRDNYPAALAREMGADIIIGVDLSQGRRSYTQVNNIGDIIGQGIEMLGLDTYERNVDIPDVKINPRLPEFSSMSFNKEAVDTIMSRGWEAAAEQDSLLREVAAVTKGRYEADSRPRAFDFHGDSLTVSEVEVTGVLPKEKTLLKDRLNLHPGQRMSRHDLDDIVAKIYGTQCYDYVTYELLGEKEPFKLVLNCKKGPIHQLGVGVRADTEEIVSVLINLGLYTHRLHGHSFDFTGKVSANPYLKFQWSYDIPKVPTLNASASFRWTDMGMLNFMTNNLSLKYFNARQELFLSNMKWRFLDLRSGLRNDVFNISDIKSSEVIGNYDMAHLTNDFVSLFLDARTDTFDDGYFPSKGLNAGLSYSWTFAGIPHMMHNFHTMQADVKGVIGNGRVFSFIPSFNCRLLFGQDIPVAYMNAIGGSLPGRFVEQQIPFIGITNMAVMENIMAMGRLDFRFRLAKNHYLTGIVNYVRNSDRLQDFFAGKGYTGAGIEYAYDTIFGPVSMNVHWSDITGKVGVYVSSGYNF